MFPIRTAPRAALTLLIVLAATTLACSPESASPPAASTAETADLATRWFAHVEALANDEMRGRETGSPEHRKAADYVAAQFKRIGLQPAGTDGYLQAVAFRSRRIYESRSSLALVRGGKAEPVVLGDDAAFGMRIDPAPRVDAPLVFAGHGLRVPETGHDDFAGLDVTGKVVVYISGSPSNVPGALSAHYQSAAERWRTLKSLGAIGVISIANPRTMDVPWERSSPNRLNAAMALADASLDDTAGQQVSIAFNPAKAERLFTGSGHTFAEILKIADAGQALPHFALPVSVRAIVAVENQDVESHNVAGLIAGSDPALANEYVVLTAHLDHVGVGAPIDGDDIYNGAMDNAAGVATLIEAAAAVIEARPKRSVVLVAVTAEEKGLLGSRYFARHPTVAGEAIVANLNTDMFLPLFALKTLMVLGLDESDLGDDVRAVAGEMGIGVQPDPQPQRNRFIRSDQYSFIVQGVPALAMKVGFEPGSPEEKIDAEWTRLRYHAPSDDLDQPIDRGAAAGYTEIVGRLSVRIANRDTRPAWKATSFFRRFAAPATPGTAGH